MESWESHYNLLEKKLEELSRTYAARTCYELKLKGVSKSGRYYIDPDGNELDSHPPIEG